MRDRILREVPEKRERCVKHFQLDTEGNGGSCISGSGPL